MEHKEVKNNTTTKRRKRRERKARNKAVSNNGIEIQHHGVEKGKRSKN